MKLKRQTSTTATPTYPATLEYGDLAVANNGIPAFGNKNNLPAPLMQSYTAYTQVPGFSSVATSAVVLSNLFAAMADNSMLQIYMWRSSWTNFSFPSGISGNYLMLTVRRGISTYGSITLHDLDNNLVYERSVYGSVWNEWEQLALNNSLGVVRSPVSGTVSVASSATATPTNICSIWLVPGTYFIKSLVKYTLTAAAQIENHIYNATEDDYPIDSTWQTLPIGLQMVSNSGFITINDTSKQIVIRSRQNSGVTLSCTAVLRVTQLK